jgi:hypothetical protein
VVFSTFHNQMRNSLSSRSFSEKGYVEERSSRWKFSSKFFKVEETQSKCCVLEKI